MKAMIIREFGDSSVFEPAEVEKPVIRAGHVLVKIAATSINTVDTMIRQMGKAHDRLSGGKGMGKVVVEIQ